MPARYYEAELVTSWQPPLQPAMRGAGNGIIHTAQILAIGVARMWTVVGSMHLQTGETPTPTQCQHLRPALLLQLMRMHQCGIPWYDAAATWNPGPLSNQSHTVKTVETTQTLSNQSLTAERMHGHSPRRTAPEVLAN